MTCEIFSGISSFADFLVWPTSCSYYFWLIIIVTLILLLAWRLFNSEQDRLGKGDLLSSLAVSSLAFTVLAVFGTLVKSTDGIPMIQSDIMLYLFALTIPLVLLWIFKKKT